MTVRFFLLALLAAAACAPRDETPAAARPVTVTSKSAAVRGDSALRRDSIIGRDSAFGPKYRIDANGKLVPIKRP